MPSVSSCRARPHRGVAFRSVCAGLTALGAVMLQGHDSSHASTAPGPAPAPGYCNALPAVSSAAGAFPRTVHVGFAPTDLTSAADGHVFVVADSPFDADYHYVCADGTVVMLDARTGGVLHAVHVPRGVTAQISARLHRLFVESQLSISAVDTRSGKLIATTPVSGRPTDFVVSEQAGMVVVAVKKKDSTDSPTSLALVDAGTGRLTKILQVSFKHVTVDLATGTFLLSTGAGVVVVDGRAGTAAPAVSVGECNGADFIPDGDKHRVLLRGDKVFCVVDATGKVTGTLKAGCNAIFVGAVGGRLYMYDSGDRNNSAYLCVMDLDTGKVLNTEYGFGYSWRIDAVDLRAGLLVMGEGNQADEEWVRSIKTGKHLHKLGFLLDAAAVDSQTGRLFFITGHTMRVYAANPWRQLWSQHFGAPLPPEGGGAFAQVVPSTHRLFVTGGRNPQGGVVTLFCTDSPCR